MNHVPILIPASSRSAVVDRWAPDDAKTSRKCLCGKPHRSLCLLLLATAWSLSRLPEKTDLSKDRHYKRQQTHAEPDIVISTAGREVSLGFRERNELTSFFIWYIGRALHCTLSPQAVSICFVAELDRGFTLRQQQVSSSTTDTVDIHSVAMFPKNKWVIFGMLCLSC